MRQCGDEGERKLLQQKVVSEDEVVVDYHFTILTFTCVIIPTGRQQYGQPTTQQGTKCLNMKFGPASQELQGVPKKRNNFFFNFGPFLGCFVDLLMTLLKTTHFFEILKTLLINFN